MYCVVFCIECVYTENYTVFGGSGGSDAIYSVFRVHKFYLENYKKKLDRYHQKCAWNCVPKFFKVKLALSSPPSNLATIYVDEKAVNTFIWPIWWMLKLKSFFSLIKSYSTVVHHNSNCHAKSQWCNSYFDRVSGLVTNSGTSPPLQIFLKNSFHFKIHLNIG